MNKKILITILAAFLALLAVALVYRFMPLIPAPFTQSMLPADMEEFLVNTTIKSNQKDPVAAMDDMGNFAIVWASKDSDSGDYEIMGRLFNKGGEPRGVEFQINQFTANHQKNPSLAMDSKGNFVVAWDSWYQDGEAWEVYARRYNHLGEPLGPEFRANQRTNSYQWNSRVGLEEDGRFLIVWLSWEEASKSYGIYGQSFDTKGEKIGSEFPVAPKVISGIGEVPSIETGPDVEYQSEEAFLDLAVNKRGDHVVVWVGDQLNGQFNIYARPFNGQTRQARSPLEVNSFRGHTQEVAVDINSKGEFIVTWMSENSDGNNSGVVARPFNLSGQPLADEFVVNTEKKDKQGYPSLAFDNNDNFLITWESDNQDGDKSGLFGQYFKKTGERVGGEFQINTHTDDWQEELTVAGGPAGTYIVAWMDWAQSLGLDGDEVFARVYDFNEVIDGMLPAR